MTEKPIKEAYRSIVLPPDRSRLIWSAIESEIPPGEENITLKRIRRPARLFLIAAVITVLLISTAYAISGIVHSTATHIMKDTGEYTDLSCIPEVERIAGFPITLPEAFSGGYSFSSLHLGGEAAYDENNEVVKEYYIIVATYIKAGKPDLVLSLTPILDLPGVHEKPVPSSASIIGNTEVRIFRDHYKLVPEGYEKTPEDLSSEAAGHYYISFGSDEIEERDYVFFTLDLDGVEYCAMLDGAEPIPDEMLLSIANDLIAEHGRA